MFLSGISQTAITLASGMNDPTTLAIDALNDWKHHAANNVENKRNTSFTFHVSEITSAISECKSSILTYRCFAPPSQRPLLCNFRERNLAYWFDIHAMDWMMRNVADKSRGIHPVYMIGIVRVNTNNPWNHG